MVTKKFQPDWRLIFLNALRFIFNVSYSMVFPLIFGAENTLASVALCVGLTMLPFADLHVRPLTMAGIVLGMNLACGLTAQLALASPWLALPLNLLFVAVLLLLTCEPRLTKPSISFLLCFVFCQATPAAPERLPLRLAGLLAGSLFTAVTLLAVWKRRGYGKNGRKLSQQVRYCARHYSYILRMSLGLTAAMFIGMQLHLVKPLWISIVVMSLTQMDLEQTIERIRLRTVGTVFGVILFVILFGLLIPQKYSLIAILSLGYLSFFTSDYKHKTIVNAVSAINASLLFLDTGTAIVNRVLCLAAGIAIVGVMWLVQFTAAHVKNRVTGTPLGQAG